jgi:tetratricopeptide (TPR) repeat protein
LICYLRITVLGQAYEQECRYEEATAQFEKGLQLLDGEALAAGPLAHVYASAGHLEKARDILKNLVEQAQTRHVDKYSVGLVYIALGMGEAALDWFERAAKERCPWFSFVALGDPRLDSLRSDPRFKVLLRLMRAA